MRAGVLLWRYHPSTPAGRPEPAIRQLSTRVVYRNQRMTLREDQVERLDGSQGTYAVIDKPDFALIIPTENDGFHLVEQYRYPTGRRMWEFPRACLVTIGVWVVPLGWGVHPVRARLCRWATPVVAQ